MTPRRALAILGALGRADAGGGRVVLFPGLVRELAAAGLQHAGIVDVDGLRRLAFRVDFGETHHCEGANGQK